MPKKTMLTIAAIAGVFLLGTACSGWFKRTSGRPEASRVPECAGLSGQAKADCERRQEH